MKELTSFAQLQALARFYTPLNIEEPPAGTADRLERIVALQKCILPGEDTSRLSIAVD